jgi:hypothetical protein
MAKHYSSKRASKKRAYKKRRTIRKLKTTLRRKMQRGGGEADVYIVKMLLQLAPQVIPIILSLIKLGNVELLISIITLLSGNKPSIVPGGMGWSGRLGGSKSNNRELQRGGGLNETVSRKLDELAVKFKDKPDVVACIEIIKARIEKEPEPAATPTDSSVELDSLEAQLTDTNITDTDKAAADTVVMETEDTALKAALEAAPVAENTPVDATLPPAVEEAAKMSIIHKMITFFNERIKSGITAKLDGMISNLRGKVGDDVIGCIKTLKTAIVEDIVTQIKNKASSITIEILNKIFRVGGIMASDIITFLLWSSVQIAMKNYEAIPVEGFKLLKKRGSQLVGAVAGRFGNLAGHVSDKAGSIMNRMRGNSENINPVNDSVPPSYPPESMSAAAPAAVPAAAPVEPKPVLGRIGSFFGRK